VQQELGRIRAARHAPKMDFIITVCDNAAGEACPVWPGQPISVHWGFADRAAVEGSDEDKRRAFAKTFRHIMHRAQLFVDLPLALLETSAIKRDMDKIGHLANE
jgi:arsenate reductase